MTRLLALVSLGALRAVLLVVAIVAVQRAERQPCPAVTRADAPGPTLAQRLVCERPTPVLGCGAALALRGPGHFADNCQVCDDAVVCETFTDDGAVVGSCLDSSNFTHVAR